MAEKNAIFRHNIPIMADPSVYACYEFINYDFLILQGNPANGI